MKLSDVNFDGSTNYSELFEVRFDSTVNYNTDASEAICCHKPLRFTSSLIFILAGGGCGPLIAADFFARENSRKNSENFLNIITTSEDPTLEFVKNSPNPHESGLLAWRPALRFDAQSLHVANGHNRSGHKYGQAQKAADQYADGHN
uniref:Uncharacterized protein n=1 Tax=Romanomermis culicivorax TaxID=13658 RepID=A0A915J265_ROMCU